MREGEFLDRSYPKTTLRFQTIFCNLTGFLPVMKSFCLTLFVLLTGVAFSQNANDSLIQQLNFELENRPQYVAAKQQRLSSLKAVAEKSKGRSRFDRYAAI